MCSIYMKDAYICSICDNSLPVSEFYKNTNGGKDGIDRRCKKCQSLRRRTFYILNKESSAKKSREWRKANPEKIKVIASRSGKKNRIRLLDITRKIRAENPCVVCGEKRINCLQFHHLDRATKNKAVAACKTYSHLKEEIDRCVILCSNCHALYHSAEVAIPNGTLPIDSTKYFPLERFLTGQPTVSAN